MNESMNNWKVGEKFAIIGFRNNPQLGTYLTGPEFGVVRRVNPDGSFSSKTVSKSVSTMPTRFQPSGYAKARDTSVYGSMSYRAFAKDDAIREIQKYADETENEAKSAKYAKMIEQIEAELADTPDIGVMAESVVSVSHDAKADLLDAKSAIETAIEDLRNIEDNGEGDPSFVMDYLEEAEQKIASAKETINNG